MKITELQLLAYGPFTETILDLSSDVAGLHVVYGPNEAGKSSALRAIHALLFGIPARCPDNHLHEYKKLRIGGVVANHDDERIEFVRRKTNKGSILNPKNKQVTAFPDDVLDTYLGGIDGDTFQRVYGIGHEELRVGGDAMRELKGLVGESLFAATIGGAGLIETIDRLDEEATELFSPTKRNARIKLSEKHYKELQKQKREARLSANEWTKLQATLRTAQEKRDEIVSRTNESRKRLERMQRIQRGLSVIGRRRQVLDRLEELNSVIVLPDSYDSAKRQEVESELVRCHDRLAELERMLDGPEKLSSQIEKIEIPDGLLEFEEAIAEVQDQRAIHVKAQGDKRILERDVELARLRADDHLRDLRISVSLDEIEQLRLTPDQRIQISALATNEKRVRERPGKIEQEITTHGVSLQRIRDRRSTHSAIRDVTMLQKCVGEILKLGALEDAVQDAGRSLESARGQAEQLHASLGLWKGTVDQSLSATVPSGETLNRFATLFEAIQADKKLLNNEVRKLEHDLVKANESISALEKTGHVPTEEQLNELRSFRDSFWQRILATKTINAGDAEQFEKAIADADNVADRLRRETERVTQLAQRFAEAESLQLQLERNEQRRNEAETRFAQFTEEWRERWQAMSVAEPLPPDEMRSWLARFSDLQKVARLISEKQDEVNRHQRRLDSARSRLWEAIDALSGDKIVEIQDWSLSRLLDHAQEVIDSENASKADREELDREIERLELAIARLQNDRKTADEELEAWQSKWTPAMKQVGLDQSASAEQANLRMEHLQTLFETVQQIDDKRKRIRDIEADSTSFENATKRLSQRFLPDALEQSADEVALLLKSRLEQATRDHERRRQLELQLQETIAEATKKQEQSRNLQHHLDRLLALAGTVDSSKLAQIEQDSNEKRTWQQRLEDLDEQLHGICGNMAIDDFVDEASEWDQDELAVQISAIESELATLETKRDEAVTSLSEIQAKVDAADGNARVSELDQESLGVIARMQRDAMLYMQRKLAHRMLCRQIEAHRAENEDPLLERASVLFARLTCDEFEGIKTDYDGDHPVIVGVRPASEDLVQVTGMSDGTRDQLYLALRLAYVEKQLSNHEPMPFIVDDILVHFDDRRSQATLEVLEELATKTQVIFFTHHIHLVELAQSSLPEGSVVVHQLARRSEDGQIDES